MSNAKGPQVSPTQADKDEAKRIVEECIGNGHAALSKMIASALAARTATGGVRVVRSICTIGEGSAGPHGVVNIAIDRCKYPVAVGQSIAIIEPDPAPAPREPGGEG